MFTHNEELDAEEEEEAGDHEEDAPLGVLADDLEDEVEEPEKPDHLQVHHLADAVVREGLDVDRLGCLHLGAEVSRLVVVTRRKQVDFCLIRVFLNTLSFVFQDGGWFCDSKIKNCLICYMI